MRRPQRVERRLRALAIVDGCFLIFSAAAALWLAYVLLRDGFAPGWPMLLLVAFWLVFTYLALPRLHRVLSRIYVPDYFLGRARTGDGLLGDPVNVALRGSEQQLHRALTAAGWRRADDLGLAASIRIVTSTLRRRSYGEAPVSSLYLFDRQQDFAYQREVGGNPSQRHHVRFWRCPEGWRLPGGFTVDWLAAGTFDRSVGLSLFTLQVTHRIGEQTDRERDLIVSTITEAVPQAEVEVIRSFSTGYHARGGGGDRIQTDGDLPIIDLGALPASPQVAETDSRDRRPAPVVIGAGIAMIRAVMYVVTAVVLLTGPGPDLPLAAVVALAALVDAGLALAVLAGHNWARLALMTACAVTVVWAFIGSVGEHRPVDVPQLPAVGGSILVLLALSSHRARQYAARRSTPGR